MKIIKAPPVTANFKVLVKQCEDCKAELELWAYDFKVVDIYLKGKRLVCPCVVCKHSIVLDAEQVDKDGQANFTKTVNYVYERNNFERNGATMPHEEKE